MNRNFIEKDLWMAHKPMKICSMSLAIGKCTLKPTRRSHYTPIRMAKTEVIAPNAG